MFEKYGEGFDWCGLRNIWEEAVLGDVSGWV